MAADVARPTFRKVDGKRGARAVRAEPAAERQTLQDLLLDRYKHLAYRVFGQHLEKRLDRRLLERLKQADYNVTPSIYHALMATTAIVAFVAATLLGALVFGVVFRNPLWPFMGAGLGGGAAILTLVAFPVTLNARIGKRRTALEKELPFSLSELSVLASVGLSPIGVVRKMADRRHDPAMTGEFRKVVHMTDVQGKDLITALSETAKESPSPALRETFWDLASMIHQGGDLDIYLRSRSAEVLELKRATQKEFVDQLTTYADMYVTIVLIGVMFLSIGAFLLDAFRDTAGPLDADGLLLVLTYGLVPLIVLMVGILLNAAYSKVE